MFKQIINKKSIELFFLFNGISLFLSFFLGIMFIKYINTEYISIWVTILKGLFLIILAFATTFSWKISIKELNNIIKKL